tara:strand:+ start:246 stop:632 length:387 start_codon:yes stop_codon:yes gene_type:complete
MISTKSDTDPVKEIELGEANAEKKEEEKKDEPSIDDDQAKLNGEDNAIKVADKPATSFDFRKRGPNLFAMIAVIGFPIILELFASTFSPIFYRNVIDYPVDEVENVSFCNITTNVGFVNSADDWRAAL